MKWIQRTAYALVFLLVLPNTGSANRSEVSDPLCAFIRLIGNYGWTGSIPETYLPVDSTISQRSVNLRYAFPEGDGYYQRIGVYQLKFRAMDDIPLHDGKIDQVYPYCFSPGAFPIQNYKELFPGVLWDHFEYIRWNAYRNRSSVYVVYAHPTRQDIDTLFGLLVSYVRIHSESDLAVLENRLKRQYEQRRNFHEGVRIIQSVLQHKGHYEGKIDGMFGNATRKAFQRYLKIKGYYHSAIDGLWGKASMRAWARYQRDLNVRATDQIDLESARAMEKAESE